MLEVTYKSGVTVSEGPCMLVLGRWSVVFSFDDDVGYERNACVGRHPVGRNEAVLRVGEL